MTPHDGEQERPESGTEHTTDRRVTSTDHDTTGTWTFVSPFATSPESYGAASNQRPPGPDARPEPPTWQPPTGPTAGPPPGQPMGQPAEPPAWGAPGSPPTWGAPGSPPGPNGKPPSRWKPWQKVAAGGALAAVIAVGGVAAVTAANASSDDTATTQAGTPGAGFGGGTDTGRTGTRGALAGAMELANALHGDFVVSSGSGTRTMRLQTGEITALSSDSVTVKSTDGYTSTYAVGSGLDLSSVAVGNTVRVIGTVNGDAATATSVQSGSTAGGGFGQGWLPPGQGAGQAGAGQGATQPPDA